MKQYKEGNIGTLVPQEERIRRGGKGPWYYAVPVGHILCTIEDLRELWSMAKEAPSYPGVFELFLKSKGIDI